VRLGDRHTAETYSIHIKVFIGLMKIMKKVSQHLEGMGWGRWENPTYLSIIKMVDGHTD
jgi:hypothetical protein